MLSMLLLRLGALCAKKNYEICLYICSKKKLNMQLYLNGNKLQKYIIIKSKNGF